MKNNKSNLRISKEALDLLVSNKWKGNVRELENFIERIVVMSSIDDTNVPDHFFDELRYGEKNNESNAYLGRPLEEVERELILSTIDMCDGNKSKAADILGVTVRTLRNKLKKYSEEGIL